MSAIESGPATSQPGVIVRGTDGDDRLVLASGATAVGGGGDDVFVLSPGGARFEPLATILDFGEGDSLDVSAFGEAARVMGFTSPGSQVIAIDFDGDDHVDGLVFVLEDRPIPVDFEPFPIGGPVPGGPMPVEPGPHPIGGPIGEVTILPAPPSWDVEGWLA